jgi:uncharacterized protein
MKMTIQTIGLLILIGLSAGLISGMVGVGGGIVMVPLLLLLGISQHQAQGTSLAVLALPVTFLAAYNYYEKGYVDWKFALIIGVFFVIGGFIGSKFAVSIDQKILKKIFGAILLIAAGQLFFSK